MLRLLVTTDGSKRSLVVLPHAVRLARAAGGEVVLARILESRTLAGQRDAAASAARAEDELAAGLAERGIEAAVRVVLDEPGRGVADTILDLATELDADLIAMDSRGEGLIRHALLGSVTMAVLGVSALPVMVTGTKAGRPGDAVAYRMLITSDGSAASHTIFIPLAPFLTPGTIAVTLLRFAVPRMADRGARAELDQCRREVESLRALLPARAEVAMLAQMLPEFETEAHAIVRTAEAEGATAIAMATQGYSARRHVLLGSVALGVLGSSPSPVILARAGVG